MAVIDVMANMGLDALTNHFAVVIPNFTQLGTNVANLNMRVLSVDIPDREIGTYEIIKRGRKMDRPNGISEQNREVSFTFRQDKYMGCYKSIHNWMNYIQNNQTMAMASDSGTLGLGGQSEFRHDVEVWALTNLDEGKPHTIWTLEGAYPTSIDGISFDETNGDPIETSVTLNCMNIIYPTL